MKTCLKDPCVLTVDVLYNMMEAFCNVQVVTKSQYQLEIIKISKKICVMLGL